MVAAEYNLEHLTSTCASHTAPCTFSTSQLPKVLGRWAVLKLKCSEAPKLRCFAHFDFEMCSAPQRPAILHPSSGQMAPHPLPWQAYFSTFWSHKSLEKHSESRLLNLFAHLHLLSSHSFSSLIFSLLFFSILTLATSAFPSLHIVGSLTSKLSAVIIAIILTSFVILMIWYGSHLVGHTEKMSPVAEDTYEPNDAESIQTLGLIGRWWITLGWTNLLGISLINIYIYR